MKRSTLAISLAAGILATIPAAAGEITYYKDEFAYFMYDEALYHRLSLYEDTSGIRSYLYTLYDDDGEEISHNAVHIYGKNRLCDDIDLDPAEFDTELYLLSSIDLEDGERTQVDDDEAIVEHDDGTMEKIRLIDDSSSSFALVSIEPIGDAVTDIILQGLYDRATAYCSVYDGQKAMGVLGDVTPEITIISENLPESMTK